VWSLAERMARTRRVCVGKHIARRQALVSRRALPALRTLAGSNLEPSPLERDLVEVVREAGPLTSPELRRLLGLSDARAVKRALERLQAVLVLTQAGEAPQEHGWDANVYDLVERRFPVRRLPQPERARRQLVELVLRAAGEVSAADVAAVLPLTRREAKNELELLATSGDALRLDEIVYKPTAP
jgi:predicted ArsR family transcriptional regulator